MAEPAFAALTTGKLSTGAKKPVNLKVGAGAGPMNWPKARGKFATGTVSSTVFVTVSITETVWLSKFGTYTREPSGVTATPDGFRPTATVVTTIFETVSMTETVFRKGF